MRTISRTTRKRRLKVADLAGIKPVVGDVMLIDDERDPLTRGLSERLVIAGYRLLEAALPETLFHIARPQRPALVVLNSHAAGADRLVLCERFERAAATRDVPLIVLHPRQKADIILRARPEGTTYLVRTPCHLDVVWTLVEQTLAQRSRTAP